MKNVCEICGDSKNYCKSCGTCFSCLDEERELLNNKVKALKECLSWALEWIDAVPSDTVLPAMPGFDRDYVNGVMNGKGGQQ